jgi:hypothetical protein
VVIMSFFIYNFLPETKGVPIEEIAIVWRNHPFWRKFVCSDGDTPTDGDIQMGKRVDTA